MTKPLSEHSTLFWLDAGGCHWCGRNTDSKTEGHDGMCPVPYVFQLEAKLAEARRENEKLKEAIKLDFHEGQMEVDKALAEFGYDSLRFADVRHGWFFSTRHGIDILKGDDDGTE